MAPPPRRALLAAALSAGLGPPPPAPAADGAPGNLSGRFSALARENLDDLSGRGAPDCGSVAGALLKDGSARGPLDALAREARGWDVADGRESAMRDAALGLLEGDGRIGATPSSLGLLSAFNRLYFRHGTRRDLLPRFYGDPAGGRTLATLLRPPGDPDMANIVEAVPRGAPDLEDALREELARFGYNDAPVLAGTRLPREEAAFVAFAAALSRSDLPLAGLADAMFSSVWAGGSMDEVPGILGYNRWFFLPGVLDRPMQWRNRLLGAVAERNGVIERNGRLRGGSLLSRLLFFRGREAPVPGVLGLLRAEGLDDADGLEAALEATAGRLGLAPPAAPARRGGLGDALADLWVALHGFEGLGGLPAPVPDVFADGPPGGGAAP